MLMKIRKRSACRKHIARLEALLDARTSFRDSENTALPADTDFANHLAQCAGCRAALEAAELAGNLLREARPAELGPGDFFAARVVTHIRAEQETRRAGANFWKPIEVLARKLVWASAFVLLVFSTFVYEMKPAHRTIQSPQDTAADRFPEGAPQSADEDDVLVSLAERGR